MKLEIAEFPVKQIRLSHRFSYENQVLEVDEGELLALVREDMRIEDVSWRWRCRGRRRALPVFATSSSRDVKFPAADRFCRGVGRGRRRRRGADPSTIRHDGGRRGGL